MRMHYLQHVPYLGPGIIQHWAEAKGCHLGSTLLHNREPLPDPASIDGLIILGGLVNVYDDQLYWLEEEKEFIRQCIRQNKKVLGISLGAQLLADALGAEVYTNRVKEVGWYQVSWNSNASSNPLFSFLPRRQMVLHWHNDTFRLPLGAARLASSRCCKNQAFIYNNHVVGLQFHLELQQTDLEQFIEHNREVLKERGQYMQSAEHLLDRPEYIRTSNKVMVQFLDKFFQNKHDASLRTVTSGMRY